MAIVSKMHKKGNVSSVRKNGQGANAMAGVVARTVAEPRGRGHLERPLTRFASMQQRKVLHYLVYEFVSSIQKNQSSQVNTKNHYKSSMALLIVAKRAKRCFHIKSRAFGAWV